MITLNTNWATASTTTKNAVQAAKALLDGRVKEIKEASQSNLDRVLTSFFSYGSNEYQIILDAVPEADRALLDHCRGKLTGDVLQRTAGRNGYKLKDSWVKFYQTETIHKGPSVGRFLTDYGSTILDQSYNQVPLEQITHLNLVKTGYVKVINPNTQTNFFLEGNLPSIRWNSVEPKEEDIAVLEWMEIRDRAVASNFKTIAPYNYDTFICHDPTQALNALSIASLKQTGKKFNYLAEWSDKYGRKGLSWGSGA